MSSRFKTQLFGPLTFLTLTACALTSAISFADPRPVVRDHRGNGNGRPVVRDHRNQPAPVVRDHRPGHGNGNGHGRPPGVGRPDRPRPDRPRPPHARPRPRRPRPVVAPAYPNRPVFHPRRPGRLYVRPIRDHRNHHEVDAAELIADRIRDRGCERAGEALREISNFLLDATKYETAAENQVPPPPPGADMRTRMRYEMQNRWKRNLRSPEFMKEVFDRLAEMYRSCDRQCFDDGEAIGQISGTGYCAGSIAVGGFAAPGFTAQLPMPVCQTATFAGCQQGYDEAVSSYQGCEPYIEGGFTDVFLESKSQDCRMDE